MQPMKKLMLLAAVCLFMGHVHAAGTVHDVAPAEVKGSHGGKLLIQGDISIELKIFEQGVPPEYRAWVTRDGHPVTDNMELGVTLTRLGGKQDTFGFTLQDGYWQGSGEVTEPHSFDVEVTLTVDGKPFHWQWESYEGRTRIAANIAETAGIRTAIAGAGQIERILTVYGNLAIAPERMARVHARFPGMVTQVNAGLGARVTKGALLAQVESNDSLRTYGVHSPIDGVVIERRINNGDITGNEPLFTVADLGTLWAELKVFPGQRAEVAVGQPVRLHSEDVHGEARILSLLPDTASAPHSVARVGIDNAGGLLTPGMLVSGDIVVESAHVPLIVDNRALQSFRDWTVVFVQVGDTYEIRPLTLGRRDGRSSEVLSGLNAGDRYVVANSYLIKADIEKSGASHDH